MLLPFLPLGSVSMVNFVGTTRTHREPFVDVDERHEGGHGPHSQRDTLIVLVLTSTLSCLGANLFPRGVNVAPSSKWRTELPEGFHRRTCNYFEST